METQLYKSREVPGVAWIAGTTWYSYASSLAGRGGKVGLKAVISLPKVSTRVPSESDNEMRCRC
jgi:hypothetical protein